ncbi:uncharacterized protein LOC124933065 isoform X2 [Impatiens glandulifera]|uniref:uncharacterized protein LOC124933065 isoform X2 n=1 Tax=Impatiens glandulifera TaxID=253017 RepID=UPI001FB12113|nr:uncharacterized protein LOC124933065 isoform X2 [Impatiens glandulifera]
MPPSSKTKQFLSIIEMKIINSEQQTDDDEEEQEEDDTRRRRLMMQEANSISIPNQFSNQNPYLHPSYYSNPPRQYTNYGPSPIIPRNFPVPSFYQEPLINYNRSYPCNNNQFNNTIRSNTVTPHRYHNAANWNYHQQPYNVYPAVQKFRKPFRGHRGTRYFHPFHTRTRNHVRQFGSQSNNNNPLMILPSTCQQLRGSEFDENSLEIGQKCKICKEDLSVGDPDHLYNLPETTVLPCQHAFHMRCLQFHTHPAADLIQPPCPFCPKTCHGIQTD